jgi:biotin transporter BioY
MTMRTLEAWLLAAAAIGYVVYRWRDGERDRFMLVLGALAIVGLLGGYWLGSQLHKATMPSSGPGRDPHHKLVMLGVSWPSSTTSATHAGGDRGRTLPPPT